jgi:hypothetical protein
LSASFYGRKRSIIDGTSAFGIMTLPMPSFAFSEAEQDS